MHFSQLVILRVRVRALGSNFTPLQFTRGRAVPSDAFTSNLYVNAFQENIAYENHCEQITQRVVDGNCSDECPTSSKTNICDCDTPPMLVSVYIAARGDTIHHSVNASILSFTERCIKD